MPHLDCDGRNIYYEGRGQGPAILLIRGLSRSMRFWEPLASRLERDFRVICFDHRGIGRSEPGDGGFYSTADLAVDAVRVLDACAVESAHIFGLSMGGMVAQEVALSHPRRVDRLILGATRAGGPGAPRPRIGAFLSIALVGALSGDDAVRRTAPWIVSSEFLERSPEVVVDWKRWLAEDPMPAGTLMRQIRAAWTHDVGNRVSQIAAPTLVITGDADRLVPWENSKRIAAAVPSSDLEVLPGVGHDFPAEMPEATARLIRAHCLAK